MTYSMCGCSTHGTIPPFACGQARAVNLEALRAGIPRRCSFQTSYIAPMTELSLGIAANDIVVEDFRQPECLLFLRSLLANSGDWRCQRDGQVAQEKATHSPNMDICKKYGDISSLRYSAML